MGGVVTTTAGDSLIEKISKRFGISVEEFFKFSGKDSDRDFMKELDNGILSAKEFWKIFEKRSGISINCDWFRLLFHPVLNKKTEELIYRLKKSGNRVVCGTNTIDSHYDNHLSRGDYSIFDMTYASIHMGVSKPDPKFWQIILDCEQTSAENAFFTDDKEENCVAASKLGIKTYHFDCTEELEKNISCRFLNRY